MILANTLVLIWGLRMTIHIALRTKLGTEDRRFMALRRKLMEGGGPVLYYSVAFFGIFMFNGVVITAINASTLHISMHSLSLTGGNSLVFTDYLGAAVWAFGFTFLTVADV